MRVEYQGPHDAVTVPLPDGSEKTVVPGGTVDTTDAHGERLLAQASSALPGTFDAPPATDGAGTGDDSAGGGDAGAGGDTTDPAAGASTDTAADADGAAAPARSRRRATADQKEA